MFDPMDEQSPLVNDVTAAGQTVPQFQAMLTKRLKTYLKDPIVSKL